MTPELFAETYEKARYESMLNRRWEDLRPTERQARAEVALTALESSGLADVLRAAHETALRAQVAEGLLAQRDAELARRGAEHREREAALEEELTRAGEQHDAAVARLRAEHDDELARLRAAYEAELEQVRTEHEAEVDRRRALRDGLMGDRAGAVA